MVSRSHDAQGVLRLHRASRADLLVDALADVLRTPQADPFARELVIVPAKGVERWVSQRLSHALGTGSTDDGVCAGVEFRAPRSIVAEIVGPEADDPWSPDTVVWPLLEVVDASLGQPWCPALTRHLGQSGLHGDDVRRGRRWAVAHRLARLFASYAAQRPRMLADWEAGVDTDGAARPVDPDLRWQPELWRRLVARVAQPSPVVRHDVAVERLAVDPDASDLPPRLSLLGHTRLTVTEVDLLRALAEHRQVDIWLPHASDALWHALRDPTSTGPVPRGDDATHLAALHPLLATLGRDVRELQRTLTPIAATSVALDVPSPRPSTLLGRLQSDIEANRAPAADHAVDPSDRSVQVHACHGAARQVEVLREVVLGLLADDPTLEPRDILVMCPDIERFAPLVEAAFGLGGVSSSTDGWHPGQQLQVRLADRSLVQTNPLLGVIGRLLDLAGSRAPATTILDLAGTEPVRRRFGFTDDDLDTMTRWVDETGVRWAFDADHRAPYGLDAYVQNTWRFGLDRMLAGAAVSADAHCYFGPTLPYDAVGSSGIDLVGRLTEMVERLRVITDRLSGTDTVVGWVETLRTAVAALTDVGWGEEWQVHQAERELAAIGAEQADAAIELSLTDIRSLMGARLVGRPTRANFRTGSLTVCTMVPMRSVPHRVVCLLGVDDGVFPRAGSPDGDDVLARRPLTGERDPRSEDRQLLLDAVLAASEALVITYSGADEVTGRPRPPAVPLGELLDATRLTVRGSADHVLVHHPLQRFDERNFTAARLGRDTPFSFDVASRAAAVAGRGPAASPPTLADLVLADAPTRDVDLAALGAFLRTPAKDFLRRRLGLKVFGDDDVIADSMPVELDGLQRWAVGTGMLEDRQRGLSPAEALNMAWRRGDLPPGRLGWEVAREIADTVTPLADRALDVMGGVERSSLDVDVDLGDGRHLRGTVTGLHGERVVVVSYSKFGARHYLDAWLPLLALAAGRPGTAWTAGTVARTRGTPQLVVFSPIDAEIARQHLRDLVALRDLGMAQPLRLPLKTGFVLAKTIKNLQHASAVQQQLAHRNAAAEWNDRFLKDGRLMEGENTKDHHRQVWGVGAPYDVLLDAAPELTITALAERLWRPVLDAAVLA